MTSQIRTTVFKMMTVATSLVVAGAVMPAVAGGECAPKLREVEAKMAAMPDTAVKVVVRKLFEDAQKAANNYNDEGCLEHAKEALAKIVVAR